MKSEKRIETVQEHLKSSDACLAEKWTEAADAMKASDLLKTGVVYSPIIEVEIAL